MLVIPQKAQVEEDGVTPRTSYLVVKYDMTYTNGDQKVVYKDCVEKIKLDDYEKDASQGQGKGQLFNAGAVLTFNIGFKIHGITMDVSETNWEDDEERQLPIEDKQTGDNGGE